MPGSSPGMTPSSSVVIAGLAPAIQAQADASAFVSASAEVTDELGAVLDDSDIVVLVTVERTFLRLARVNPAPMWDQSREIIRRLEAAPLEENASKRLRGDDGD